MLLHLRTCKILNESVRNLVMTNKWDRPFHPEIASGVRSALFQPFGPVTVSDIRDKIKNILSNYEPRVKSVIYRCK